MPRAVAEFQDEGFEVVPVPADFWVTQEDSRGFGDGSVEALALSVLPEAESLSYTTRAIKEYIGLAVHHLARLLR
jgi:uncharacterized SAM-binding protein YcdF (DUF218 family)